MATWTLNGTNVNTLGIKVADIQYTAGGADRLGLVQTGDGVFGDAAEWSYLDSVVLNKDGGAWFQGIMVGGSKFGRPNEEGWDYEVRGPWWWLENYPLRQVYKVLPIGGGALTTKSKSRVLLGYNSSGTKITTMQAIDLILDYAIAAGCPVDKGSIPSTTIKIVTEMQDASCAEAILNLLRWTPDLIPNFNHSTGNLGFDRRSTATTVSFSIGAAPVKGVSVRSRPDLQVPGVGIYFEKVDYVDDVPYQQIEADEYPNAAAADDLGAANFTIDLEGGRTTTQKQTVETATLPTTNNDTARNWFKDHVSWLADFDNADLQLTTPEKSVLAALNGGSSTTAGDYPRELVEGSVQPWMSGVKSCRMLVKASFRYTGPPTTASRKHFDRLTGLVDVAVEVAATDATSKTYKRVASVVAGEATPSGYAQAYYDALSTLQYEGSVTLLESDVGGTARPGKVLNLTGGDSAWSTMKGVIHSVREDLIKGQTVIDFGPQAHVLGPQDWLEIQRANRANRRSYRTGAEIASATLSNDEVDGGVVAPNTNDMTAPGAGSECRWELRPAKSGTWSVQFGDGVLFLPIDGEEMKTVELAASEESSVTGTTYFWLKIPWLFDSNLGLWVFDSTTGLTHTTDATKPADVVPENPSNGAAASTYLEWGSVIVSGDTFTVDQVLCSDLHVHRPAAPDLHPFKLTCDPSTGVLQVRSGRVNGTTGTIPATFTGGGKTIVIKMTWDADTQDTSPPYELSGATLDSWEVESLSSVPADTLPVINSTTGAGTSGTHYVPIGVQTVGGGVYACENDGIRNSIGSVFCTPGSWRDYTQA